MDTQLAQGTARPLPSIISIVPLAVLIGLSLRPSMAAIGPVVELLKSDISLSYVQIALLTTLPVLAMGLGCFVAAHLAGRLGFSFLLGGSLLLIAFADGLRALAEGYASLLVTAVTAGMGIAFIQALFPVLIKHQAGQRMALVMGWYIAAIMGGAALASAVTPHVAELSGNWRNGLAIWAIPALLAWTIWQVQSRRQQISIPANQRSRSASKPLLLQPRVWTLALFFGLGTAGYTCILAWLPPHYISLGWSRTDAGMLLAVLTAVEVVSGLTLPALAQRHTDRRPVVMLTLCLAFAGFLILWLAPLRFPHLMTILLGAGIGGLFPLSLIVAMDHHPDPQRAGAIAGMVQGIGYFIAAFSPLGAGIIRDLTGTFSSAWAFLALVTVTLMATCLRFDPKRYSQMIVE